MKCPSFSAEYYPAPREHCTGDSSVCLRQIRVSKLNLAAACSSASVLHRLFSKREKSREAGMLVGAAAAAFSQQHTYIHASVSDSKFTSQLRRRSTLSLRRIVLGTVLVRRNHICGKYMTSARIKHLIENLWMWWVHVLSDTGQASSISLTTSGSNWKHCNPKLRRESLPRANFSVCR